jgi:phospholipase/lecithinase/hemolysin
MTKKLACVDYCLSAVRFLASCFFILILSKGVVFAKHLDKVVVFGDSLSDNGNFYEYMNHQVPSSPPYYQGRFTNGPSWVELIQNHTNKTTLLDYAFGGAGVTDVIDNDSFNLHSEVERYLQDVHGKLDANSLFIVWIGSNNYLSFPDDFGVEVTRVLTGIEESLEKLISLGATEILLVNVPDMGKTPLATDYDSVQMLTEASILHNQKLRALATHLKFKYKNLHLMYYDVQKLMDNMVLHPEEYGFTNTSGTCYEMYNASFKSGKKSHFSMVKVASSIKKYSYNDGFCDGYMFFDPVHPAASAHRSMAKDIKKLLVASQIELN